jgi:hypothetical protein
VKAAQVQKSKPGENRLTLVTVRERLSCQLLRRLWQLQVQLGLMLMELELEKQLVQQSWRLMDAMNH